MADMSTALVTGGAMRIGAAIVRDLARHGWSVAIHCNRSTDEAVALAEELRDSGAQVAVVQADLARADAPRRIIGEAADALGPLTLLVNNASVYVRDAFGSLDPEVWQTQFDVNLRAPVMLTEAFAAQLAAGQKGNVVNLIDQRVLKLTPQMPSYTLSKAALWAATQTLAQALAPRIRVNAIGPGPVFANPYAADQSMTTEIGATLLQRRVDPAEIARAVRFIVETPSMTGQLLVIDSGQHLVWRHAGEEA